MRGSAAGPAAMFLFRARKGRVPDSKRESAESAHRRAATVGFNGFRRSNA